MKNKLFLLFLLFHFSPSGAQPFPDEDSSASHAFDFWIGQWNIDEKILQQDGTWLNLSARTSVAPILNGEALIEHWEGEVQFFWEGMKEPEMIKGLSIRSYDPQSGTWKIYWMDSRNPEFGIPYTGTFKNDSGIFYRHWETPTGERKGRIIFSDISRKSVKWELAVSSDNGVNWQTLWIMEMHRKKE